MKLLSLFSGIGAFEKALENIGIAVELVGFSEIDKYAIKSYCAIHNVSETLNLGDVIKIDISKLPKDIDMITHGSPCQDFSIAGKQAGGNLGTGTRSSLMWNTVNIVAYTKPKYVIWENVKNLLSKKHRHNFDSYLSILENLGYNNYYKVLNAKDYGIPQNRERVYTISIRKDIYKGNFVFPEKEFLKLRLKDMLEEKVDEKYYLSEKLVKGFIKHNEKHKEKGTGFIWKPKNKDDIANTLRANARTCPTDNTIIESNSNVIGNLVIDKWQDFMKRIYDIDTYAPTISTMQGGNTEPKILIHNIKQKVRVRKYNVDIEKLVKVLRKSKENVKITNKEIAKKININLSKVEHWFRTDGSFAIPDPNIWYKLKKILKINTDEFDKSIITFVEKDGVYEKADRVYDKKGLAPTLTQQKEKILDDFRIRKLTPLECWRLMGFTDEDFYKSKSTGNSNTQLYKQAGNSIVVNVLEKIFKNLLGEENEQI